MGITDSAGTLWFTYSWHRAKKICNTDADHYIIVRLIGQKACFGLTYKVHWKLASGALITKSMHRSSSSVKGIALEVASNRGVL